MLPLEIILLIPSLIVTPLVLAAAYFWRRRKSYPRFWWTAVVICFVLTALFAVQVLSTPLYSEKDRSPDNPGGFSAGLGEILAVYLVETCIVIPAFPVLIGLAFLSPVGTKCLLVIVVLLYVGLLSWLIIQKNVRYIADYRRTKQQQLWHGDQFRHLRRP